MKAKYASILFGATMFIAGCDESSPQQGIEKYEVAKKNGDVSEGIVYLKNYISEFPSDPIGRLRLAEAYFILNDFDGSLKELDKAEEAGASPFETLELRVLNNFYGQNYEQVIWHKEQAEKQLTSESSPKALISLYAYLSHLYQGDLDYAIPTSLTGDLEIIAQKYKELFNSQSKLVSLPSFKEPGVAVREKTWLEALIANRSDNSEKAAAKLELFLDLMPNVSLARFQLVEAWIKANKYEKASSELEKIEAGSPRHVYASYLRSYIFFQNGDFKNAFKKSEYAIQNGISTNTAMFVAGVSAFQIEQYESAYRYLSKASLNMPDNKALKNFLARAKLKLGYIDEAYSDLLNMEILGENDETLLSFAVNVFSEQGRLKDASSLAEKLRKNDPTIDNLLRDAQLKLLTGNKFASNLLHEAIDKAPTTEESWMLMASSYLNNQEYDKAHRLAAEWEELNRSYGKTLSALTFQLEGKLRKAEEEYKAAIDINNKNVGARRLLIELYIKNKQYEEALRESKSLMGVNHASLSSLGHVVKLASKDSVSADVIEFLESLVEKNGDNNRLNIALALAYLEQGKKREAKRVLARVESDKSPVIQHLAGDLYLAMDDFKSAKSSLLKVLDIQPSNEIARIKLTSLFEREHELRKAEETIKTGLSLNPFSEQLKLTMIGLKIKMGKVREANLLIESISESQLLNSKELSLFTRYKGEVALINKEFGKAVNIYRRNYESKKTFDNAIKLAHSLLHNGKRAEAKVVLETEYRKLSDKSQYRHIMAEFYQSLDDSYSAIHVYEESSTKYSDDYILFNNLASLYLKEGDIEKALDAANKAFKLAPNILEIRDTLAQSYIKSGDAEYGLEIIQIVLDSNPGNDSYLLTYAEALYGLGDKASAREVIRRINLSSTSLVDRAKKLR